MNDTAHPAIRLWNHHAPARAYPAGVVAVPRPIPGVAFFPGGFGLWDARAGEALPAMPVGGVMVLGHNFDDEENYSLSLARGHESLRAPTWRNLLHLLDSVGIPAGRCFFTNLFMGLLAGGRSTGVFPGAADPAFVTHCRRLLIEQLRVQQPALVLTLGIHVPRHLTSVSSDVPEWSKARTFRLLDEAGPIRNRVRIDGLDHVVTVVALVHPSLRHRNVRWRRYAGRAGDDAERALLRDAIESSGVVLDRSIQANGDPMHRPR